MRVGIGSATGAKTFILALAAAIVTGYIHAQLCLCQTDAECMECHVDHELESEDGRGMFVDSSLLSKSVHFELECLDCHDQAEADFEDFPHFQVYQPVNCEDCHSQEAFIYMEHFNKMLKKRGSTDIPGCKECHGTHDAHRQLGMDIVCDHCHLDVVAEYRQSYHFKKYSEDPRRYPICTTCHDAHFKSKREVMSDAEYKQEIVDICSRCHQRDIETYVHSRHYQAMESGVQRAPVCTSCHERHAIRNPSDSLSSVHPSNITDLCNNCHPGHKESLHVDPGMDTSAITCASCHTGHQTDMTSINNQIFKEGGIYNQCNICHDKDRHKKEGLAHGKVMLIDENGETANCTKCHIYHWNMPIDEEHPERASSQNCEYCHAEEARDYKTSIHGVARMMGIAEAPGCSDCHGETDIEKIDKKFTASGVINLCASCHTNRELMLRFQINPYVVDGYKDTYHGKLFETGTQDIKFAVCTNCHGSHTIKPPEDPESMVSRAHIVETCKTCHPRANDRFVSYLVHPIKPSEEELEADCDSIGAFSSVFDERAEGDDRGGWHAFNDLAARFMTVFLLGVLGAFGLHTVLWFQRGIRRRVKVKERYFRRIDGFHRFLHVLVNVSFLTLAFTGLPQSYAHTDLAKWLFEHVMSIRTAQQLHYIAAAVTAFYFVAHLIYLIIRIKQNGFRRLLTGPTTMVLRMKDIKDFGQHLKWFVGRGPEPKFDRWTYWEKFDYFAVFWGVFVIGLSGLLRWQDEFFGSLLGGGIISLADTVHKEEVLLATAFIFIVHFFNTHLRARKFPMDVSVYSGRISEKDMKQERPLEYERLASERRLDEIEVKPLGVVRTVFAYLWGTMALLTGCFLLALIILGHVTAG